MHTAPKLVALALLVSACGPGRLSVDSGEEINADATTSSSSSSSTETSTGTSTSETSTSEDTSSEDTAPADTFGFVPELDLIEMTECDPFAQDCPDGEKCVPYGSTGGNWDAHKCVPVLGDQATGEPCTYGGTFAATDDCDATGMCWDVMDFNGEAIGVCTPFCTGTPDMPECPPGSSCLISGDSSINICIYTCDPILQDCSESLACFWANNGFNCIFTTEDIPSGEPCGFINDCVAGDVCVPGELLPSCADATCCSPFCDLDLGDQPCEVLPGTACVPFFEQGMAPPGYEDVGVCLTPP